MSVPSLAAVDRRISRLPALAAACAALGCLAGQTCHADASALEQAQRIGLWGTPVAANAPDTSAPPAAASRSGIVRGLAIEQSGWGGTAVRGAAVRQVAGGAPAAAGVEITDVSYRWGLGKAGNAVDVGVGASAYRVGPGTAATVPTLLAAGSMLEGRRDAVVPTLSVGMRHRMSDLHRIDLYAYGTASLPTPAAGEFYTAKVNVEWLPTRHSGLGFEQSAVNLKFGANSNFALRVRGRGPMIYYRSKF